MNILQNDKQFSRRGRLASVAAALISGILIGATGLLAWSRWSEFQEPAHSTPDDVVAQKAEGEGSTIRVDYSVIVSREELTFPGGLRPTSIAFSPDGQLIAVGGGDRSPGEHTPTGGRGPSREIGIVVLYDASTGGIRASFRTTYWVKGVAFSPDGKTLAATGSGGNSDGETQLWDVATRQLRFSLPGASGIAFSPDGRSIALGSTPSKLYEAETGRLIRHLESAWAYSVVYSPDGTRLTIGLNILDPATGKRVGDLPRSGRRVSFSPDGKFVALPAHTNTPDPTRRNRPLQIVSTDDWRVSNTLDHILDPFAVAFAPDGNALAVGLLTGEISLWGTSTGAILLQVPPDGDGSILDLAFSADGSMLGLIIPKQGLIKLWRFSAKAT